MALEGLDAGNAGKLRNVQRAGADADELRGEAVAAIGVDHPALGCVVPFEVLHLGVEQRVVVEAELAADAPALREDFGRVGVLLARPVPGLLEQRHVDHRGRVALGAGIAVPVPGAAEVAALLDDADVRDAGLDQPRAGHQPRESAADKGEGHMVGLGLPRGERRVGVVQVVREAAFQPQVLAVAVGPQPLVALGAVLGRKRLFVDRHVSSLIICQF